MPDNFIQLTGLSPKVEGLKWESDNLLRIGRQATAEVVLQDSSVERLHVEIKFHGQRWVVRPLTRSPNYETYLNQIPLPTRGTHLRLQDVLRVGKLAFRVTGLGTARSDEDMPTIPAVIGEVTELPPAVEVPPVVPAMPV